MHAWRFPRDVDDIFSSHRLILLDKLALTQVDCSGCEVRFRDGSPFVDSSDALRNQICRQTRENSGTNSRHKLTSVIEMSIAAVVVALVLMAIALEHPRTRQLVL